MTHYTCKWSIPGSSDFEYSEFHVEEDPDPPATWIVWYRCHHRGDTLDYWTRLPKRDRQMEAQYLKRAVVQNRDLTCTALDMRCELLCMKKDEIEPRQPQLERLARQIERGRAMLEDREPRKFEAVYPKV